MGIPDGRGTLTADERGFLAQCAALVRAAHGSAERELAVAAAVASARRYRAQGAGWEEIVGALGVPSAVLRDWRGRVAHKDLGPAW